MGNFIIIRMFLLPPSLKLCYMSLLAAVRTWIDLLGDTTQFYILLLRIYHPKVFILFLPIFVDILTHQ